MNNVPVGFDITLLVGGFLISGHLISGAMYFEGFAKEFAQSFDAESAEKIRETITGYGDRYKNTVVQIRFWKAAAG